MIRILLSHRLSISNYNSNSLHRFTFQMHADVCDRAVVVGEEANAPLLGGAMLAATACGLYASPEDAAAHMYRPAKRIEPNPEAAAAYDALYAKYFKVAAAARDISHILMDEQ